MMETITADTEAINNSISEIKTKVDAFCDPIINSIKSNQFKALIDCGFFTKGIESISKTTTKLKEKITTFSSNVNSRFDATVANEKVEAENTEAVPVYTSYE